MTGAALIKLLILVILAFIICLPEFFTLSRVSKVNFLCLPYRPCERGNQVKKGQNGKVGEAEIRKKDICKPSQTPEGDRWEQDCTQDHQSNMTDPELDSRRGGDGPEKSWFICETDLDMAELHSNISSSALKVNVEVSVELQLRDAQTLNLTLYGHSNHSSLHLHLPEVEDEKEDEGQGKAFYCCLPVLPTSETPNQSRCLLWLANQTVLTATAKEKLPWKRTEKDEWRCWFRVIWLVLLCVVMLTIIMIVLGQIYFRGHSCQTLKMQPGGNNVTRHQLNDAEQHREIIFPKGTALHSIRSQSQPGLTPIKEVDIQDDIETLLDGNVDHCYTANLHHRVHPFTSSLTEEQAW
ncbi:uncharacterized protein LOC131975426 [Centropristis striata]|uniref:uncharacterized protein LOC131975426 n=1 Tax=Centropristis striata TaxID=184440 RepID=UPI0027E19297|nr:uncharacterized protein LOC131975426 [Centropristis striata]